MKMWPFLLECAFVFVKDWMGQINRSNQISLNAAYRFAWYNPILKQNVHQFYLWYRGITEGIQTE